MNRDIITIVKVPNTFVNQGSSYSLKGGSQKEERLDKLEARMTEIHIRLEELWCYLDTHRFGTVPHAGFGLGFERMVQFVIGMTNIRDVIAFPRTPGSAEF